MAGELDFLARLREMAIHPAARGLADDAAVLEVGRATLVLTHDTLVEGVHFLGDDPPDSVAWKLLAVNLSDLAAKGAKPVAALMSYTLRGDLDWDRRFATGLKTALDHFGVALIGGDTVSGSERHIGMTLIGEATAIVPSRRGAREGDTLFVTGTIGDAGLGLKLRNQQIGRPELVEGLPFFTGAGSAKRVGLRQAQAGDLVDLIDAYLRPQPQLGAGQRLAPIVTAMMDVSDGLLIDAGRLAEASGLSAMIDLNAVPISAAFAELRGDDRDARLFAATAGDDYQLLFTASLPLPDLLCQVTRIGRMVGGSGIYLRDRDGAVPLPAKLGWLHA